VRITDNPQQPFYFRSPRRGADDAIDNLNRSQPTEDGNIRRTAYPSLIVTLLSTSPCFTLINDLLAAAQPGRTNGVFSVQMVRLDVRNEKLAPIGIRPRVGHRQRPALMLVGIALADFIAELIPPARRCPCPADHRPGS